MPGEIRLEECRYKCRKYYSRKCEFSAASLDCGACLHNHIERDGECLKLEQGKVIETPSVLFKFTKKLSLKLIIVLLFCLKTCKYRNVISVHGIRWECMPQEEGMMLLVDILADIGKLLCLYLFIGGIVRLVDAFLPAFSSCYLLTKH